MTNAQVGKMRGRKERGACKLADRGLAENARRSLGKGHRRHMGKGRRNLAGADAPRQGPAHKNWRIKKFRQGCLDLLAKASPLSDVAALEDWGFLERTVQYRYFVFFGIRVDKEPVVRLRSWSPFGNIVGFTLSRTEKLVDEYPGICYHCRNHENDEFHNGLLVRRFCDSCRLHLSRRMKSCPGKGVKPGCLATCWVNPIGLPSPVCRVCHAE